MALSAGARIGAYEILTLIGSGGMGEVYRARDSKLNRDVAIKVLPDLLARDRQRLARFEREAQLLASLNHPHIAHIYGFEDSTGVPALVMELVEGRTLADRIARGPIPLDEALSVAKQVTEALEAAHEQGIIHRDLKPANIKIRADGTVKVLDFGLAKAASGDTPGPDLTLSPTVTDGGTREGVILGTAAYMSPEQARGNVVDKRADIWAFGCVLYEMLSGRTAFAGETLTDILVAIVEREPDWRALPDATPANICRLLQRCLVKDLKRRLHDIADARIEIDDALTVPAVTPSVAPPASRGMSRRASWLIAATVLVALVLLAIDLVARWHRTDTPPVYHQVTFRRGWASAARFAPDGQTIVYSAAWGGAPIRLFSTRVDSPESSSLSLDSADLLSISSSGRMAIGLRNGRRTLAEVPLAGRAPRELLDDVDAADWAPRGDALVVVHAVDGRTRLEYPAGTVLHDPGPGRSVDYPRFSPKGDAVGFVDFQTTPQHTRFRIAVVDLAGHLQILSEGWSDVFGLAWAPAGDEIWFSARERGVRSGGLVLHAVTVSGKQRVVARMPGLPIIQEIWRDGRVLLKHDDWPMTMMCRLPGDATEHDLSWLDFSRARDMSLDGRLVLFLEDGLAEGSKSGVYLRKTDGSAAVRLGDGQPIALSADGTSVLAIEDASPEQLTILPTGPGRSRTLTGGGLIYASATWFPDGARILVGGREPGRPPALYVQDVAGGAPRRLVDGFDRGVVSPDGRIVATVDSPGTVTLTPVGGGPPRVVHGLPPSSELLRWAGTGRELFARVERLPVKILRFNIGTGRTDLWRTLGPADLSGVGNVFEIALTPDGQSYCYSYVRNLSALFVVDGLK